MSIGFYMMSTMNVNTTQLAAITNIIILGLGMGLVMPTLTIAVQSVFPPSERGVVTAATQFFRSIGSTLGMTILGVVMNHYSAGDLKSNFVPIVQNIPGIQAGPLSSMLAKAETDPQGLFNILLNPEAVKNIPTQMQQIMLPPLKLALANSLHYVFLVAMGIVFVGTLVSLLMGDAKIEGERNPKTNLKPKPELNNA